MRLYERRCSVRFSRSVLLGAASALALTLAGGTPASAQNIGVGFLAGDFGVNGFGNIAAGIGVGNFVTGDFNVAAGTFTGNFVEGDFNTAAGILTGNFVDGSGNAAYGLLTGNFVTGFAPTAPAAWPPATLLRV